ncbi:hypothetical protein D3C73_1341020 [compost metagenome]
MATPIVPMAAPRFSGGNTVRNTFMTTGMMMPAPLAWITRPTSIGAKPVLAAQTTDPAVNNPIAEMNSARVPNDSIRKAVIGIKIPLVSIYPVESH